MRIITLAVVAAVCFFAYAPGITCCSLAKAHFTDTFGWAGELEKDGQLVHLLVYENRPQNLALRPDGGSTGNAMILPIPSVSHSMNESNMLDGHDFAGIPESLAQTNWPSIDEVVEPIVQPFLLFFLLYSFLLMLPKKFRPLWLLLLFPVIYVVAAFVFATARVSEQELGTLSVQAGFSNSLDVQVFNKGSYTVVLATSAAAIPDALSRVPENKRPQINREIFEAYDKWYPGWTFALCCFDSSLQTPEPLVWWYRPRNPDQIFFPALDAHTGRAPVLNSLVDVDHRLVVSSSKMVAPLADTLFSPVHAVQLSRPASVQKFIPADVMGRTYTGKMPQGDFLFNTTDVRLGIFRPYRMEPAGSAGNTFLSIIDFFAEDSSLLIKIALAFLLSSILLLIDRRPLQSGQLLFSAVVLFGISPLLHKLSSESMGSFVMTNFLQFVVVTVLILAPINLAVRNKRDISNAAGIAASILVICAFALPGYSSTWWPLIWAALFVFCSHYRPRQSHTT